MSCTIYFSWKSSIGANNDNLSILNAMKKVIFVISTVHSEQKGIETLIIDGLGGTITSIIFRTLCAYLNPFIYFCQVVV